MSHQYVVRDRTDQDNLVANSISPANSTFPDRYAVRQCRPPDPYEMEYPHLLTDFSIEGGSIVHW